MADTYRQEVLNVVLAQVLQERNIVSAPENIMKATETQARRIPDILVYYLGLRLVIEGEVGDRADAEVRAFASALRRVEEGIAHIGVAVVYTASLRSVPFSELRSQLADRELSINVITEAGETGFVKGNVDYLERALREAFERLLHEDVVARATAALDAAVERFAASTAGKEGIIERLAEILNIRQLPQRERRRQDGEEEGLE